MHFIVSWNISAPTPKRKAINEEMKACLEKHSWVRPLRSFYIVKVRSSWEWNAIIERLKAVAKVYSRYVRFVASPLIQGGGYHGWLSKDLWPKVAKRTT